MLRETEVDGVQTLLLACDGPVQAGLTFRVGRADEPLARAGITHLLEHLALFRHGLGDYHYNGATGPVVTHFHASGSPDEVVAFFDGLCAGLSDPPFERLETEKSILRTEEAGTDPPAEATLARLRHGARDYGLLGYREVGLPRVSADDLAEWSRAWFTRENAVLWVSAGEVPAGLRLRLPEGVRRPAPEPSSALPSLPAYAVEHRRGTTFGAIVRRSTAAGLYAAVLERELYRELRQEGGYSYSAGAVYEPNDGSLASLYAAADAATEHRDAVLCSVVDVLARMRHGRIEPADLDIVRTRAQESLRLTEREPGRLPVAAFNVLTGAPNPTDDELRAEMAAVTVDDLRAVAVEAAGTGLLLTHRDAAWTGFAAAPTHSDHAVEGVEFLSREEPDRRLVVGPDGVSLTDGPDRTRTVRYADCVAALSYADGGRSLIGADGIVVAVEPTLHEISEGTVARIDADLPPAVLVPMPARTPDRIPQPRPPAPRPKRRRSAGHRLIVSAAALAAVLALLCTCGVVRAFSMPGWVEKALVVVGILVAIALGLVTALLWSQPGEEYPAA